jgi:hypothetical protein
MRRLLLFSFLFTSSLLTLAQVHVRGYYRSNGTYVQPHERTRPNHTIKDNYSYPGNYNPNTGRITGGSVNTHSSTTPTPKERSQYSPSTSNSPSISTYDDSNASHRDSKIISSFNTVTSLEQLYALVEPNAALKAEPMYTANSRYAIPRGASVKVKKYNEDYYIAEVDSRNGYVCTCQVKKVYSKL